MDIEEYLRQKRELEAKKEMLEAKEKVVDHDKERFKKEQRAKIYAEHGVNPKHSAPSEPYEHTPAHHHTSSSGPGMWNTLLLFLILILLAVTYFIPRFGEEQIRNIVSDESGGKTVDPEENQVTAPSSTTTTNQNNEPASSEEEETPEGPLFSLSVRDDEEGQFDDNGKIDDEILVLSIESGPKYYEDFTLQFINKETEPIMCKLDRDIEIDTDFDGRIDIKDADVDRFKIELDPKATKTITSDVVPGSVETGTYEGTGDIHATYEARCYFCLDEDCNKIDDEAESTQEAFFRVWINKEDFLTNSTNNSN